MQAGQLEQRPYCVPHAEQADIAAFLAAELKTIDQHGQAAGVDVFKLSHIQGQPWTLVLQKTVQGFLRRFSCGWIEDS